MSQIPESYKQYLSPAQLQELQIMEAQQAGQRQPQLTFEQWLAQNPQYAEPGQAPGKNKNPYTEAAKDAAKGYVKGKINNLAKGGTQTPATMTGSGTAFSSGTIYQGQPIGSATDGGTMMSTGQVVPVSEGAPVGPAGADGSAPTGDYAQGAAQLAQGALGAYQAYNGYNQYQDGNKVGGALNMAGGGANVAAAAGSSTAASATPYLSAALGGYNAYNAATGPGSDEQRANEATKALGMAAADFYTFGGASLAKHAFGKEIGKVEEKIDSTTENPYYQIAFNPYMYAAVKGMDAVGLNKESTRDTAKRHTGQLLKQSEDPGYQAYVQGMREQYNSAPPDPSKPFAGKYGSWGEYEKAGLEADNLTGVMGNIESFGQDWSKLNFDQQKAVTQALIDAKQYESKKGEVLVKDQNKAREIYDTVSKGGFKIPVAPAPTVTPLTKPAVQAVATPTPVKRVTFPTRGYSATGILGGK